MPRTLMAFLALFLSTPSARRATCRLRQRQDWETNFYPRPPRGGRRLCRGRGASSCGISIHALREEGDKIWGMGNVIIAISIHALREEGDAPKETKASCQFYFYPRPPRGGRPDLPGAWPDGLRFLSTPSARRATVHHGQRSGCQKISIHALREEGDIPATFTPMSGSIFLSTPSARRATLYCH